MLDTGLEDKVVLITGANHRIGAAAGERIHGAGRSSSSRTSAIPP
jgi:NAD(P)-dependent dehydrogenase (short-subunit alcohol dehydrogenase family)